MKNKHILFSTLLLTMSILFIFNSCKEEEDPELNLVTLMAGTIDLNGATAPDNVPVNPTIVATFSTDVDASTATESNITLLQDYNDSIIDLTITALGNSITIVPAEELSNGALYQLSFGAGLKASNGKTLTMVDRTFTTEGTFVPAGQVASWSFEDNADDQAGSFDGSAVDISYVPSRNSVAGKAAYFNGSTSIIRVPNGDQLMNTSDFTLTFWVKSDTTRGQFVMGLAGWNGFQYEIFGDYGGTKLAAQYDFGDGTTGSEDLWFNGDATNTTKDNGGWQGWTFAKDLTTSGGLSSLLASKWAMITCIYNGTAKTGTLYINGEKMKSQDFNLWPEGDKKKGIVGLKYVGNPGNNTLVFGFIQDDADATIGDDWAKYSIPTNNHFKGQLDDIRIYHKVLTETEIQLMYNSEKP